MKKCLKAFLVVCLLLVVGCSKQQDSKKNETVVSDVVNEEWSSDVDGGKLFGTLTLPQNGSDTVILLVAGSGPVPKDGTVNEFYQLANALADKGIATLRYDKRGMFDSSNIHTTNETIRVDDFVQDIEVLLKDLKEDGRFKRVFLLGHSQGALYGAMAIEHESVDGFISLCGAGRTMDVLLKEQLASNPYNPKEIVDEANTIIDHLKNNEKVTEMNPQLQSLFDVSLQDYLIQWISIDPVNVYTKINEVPTLIIQGDNDTQVSVEDAKLLHEAIPNSKLVIVEHMSHVLKDAKDKSDYLEHMKVYTAVNDPINRKVVDEIQQFVSE